MIQETPHADKCSPRGKGNCRRGRKKRQTQVCCLNILLVLSVKNGDVMRSNSLGLV